MSVFKFSSADRECSLTDEDTDEWLKGEMTVSAYLQLLEGVCLMDVDMDARGIRDPM